MDLKLNGSTWAVGTLIGGGGFGKVYEATSGNRRAVVKLIPKSPGAERELLFVQLSDVRNVIPVIDGGETADSWALVMPRADKSLRQHREEAAGPLTESEALPILKDIAETLRDLAGKVVHRDIKPENILLYNGKWCLADFGISRYAEATTAPDTQKFALSPLYAAPERWREERAESATDIYSFGVIAYELLTGSLPFLGPDMYKLREQHLHVAPQAMPGVRPGVAALVDQCLHKAPGARPSASSLLDRLNQLEKVQPVGGLAALQKAAHVEVQRQGEASRAESAARTETEHRAELLKAATRDFASISRQLRTAITDAAPVAKIVEMGPTAWTATIGSATLILRANQQTSATPWENWDPPAFNVISHTSVSISLKTANRGYEGRSHSLWYCDAKEEGRYQWYETSFMVMPLLRSTQRTVEPFALDPGIESAKAIWNGMAEFQAAWPFTALDPGDLTNFIDRWAQWLAARATGSLARPSSMPERNPAGSWRRRGQA
ncbi:MULTISPECIES: serine/threonine-protein kinase [unclassified Streptomyces]|uniref:serine/threonine-protein kinase n=1 Tax=unclassified Streptomyces TaxID=2593676 RepID=UPI0033A72E55